ncbi:unnamed protein product [Lathyrus sativus]|nr:unnamed protein product [Lathyrus sativus]
MEKPIATEKVSHYVSDDLTLSILSKLPLKSLKRFSCVRKLWSLLFENPIFMNVYRNNFISSDNSYFDEGSCFLLQKDLPYLPYVLDVPEFYLIFGKRFENKVKLDWPHLFQGDNQAVHILGPVINGVVCLYQGQTPCVLLWNPATQESKTLPSSPTESSIIYEGGTFFYHGFGYDYVRDDYKVIRHVSYRLYLSDFEDDMEGKPIKVSRDDTWEICSLKSNSWKKLDLDMPICIHAYVGVFVSMKGMCHWHGDKDGEPSLVSLDLHNEVFYTTPLPSNSWEILRHLMILNESIALISYYVGTTTFHISILGEFSVKESWTELFIIGHLPYLEHPIGEGNNGDLFFRKKDDELVLFNLSTQMIQELGIKGPRHFCQILIYKESLYPI